MNAQRTILESSYSNGRAGHHRLTGARDLRVRAVRSGTATAPNGTPPARSHSPRRWVRMTAGPRQAHTRFPPRNERVRRAPARKSGIAVQLARRLHGGGPRENGPAVRAKVFWESSMTARFFRPLLVAGAIALASCGASSSGNGTLAVALVDAP